ncbi:MAG: DUF4363 family protein [Firmicutes bacterium]|nr:DUF4363 family protein [Bacillota bacterium]
MRLSLILAAFLIAFLALGILAEKRMKETGHELLVLLRQSERALAARDRAEALTALRRFKKHWAKTEKTWALVSDHHEMDQVDLAVDRADKYLSTGSLPEAAAEIASLIFLIEHIPKKETLGLRSVF